MIQATCVIMDGKGILLCGQPGSGKSDLALRLIDRGAMLIADDLVEIEVKGSRLVGRFPFDHEGLDRFPSIDLLGVLEVRGLGLLRVPFQKETVIDLVVDLDTQAERLPQRRTTQFLGVTVSWMALDGFEASAVAKIRAASRCEILVNETVDG